MCGAAWVSVARSSSRSVGISQNSSIQSYGRACNFGCLKGGSRLFQVLLNGNNRSSSGTDFDNSENGSPLWAPMFKVVDNGILMCLSGFRIRGPYWGTIGFILEL